MKKFIKTYFDHLAVAVIITLTIAPTLIVIGMGFESTTHESSESAIAQVRQAMNELKAENSLLIHALHTDLENHRHIYHDGSVYYPKPASGREGYYQEHKDDKK